MFVFSDRKSMRPGRYKVTKDSGESYYITLERADEPTVAGTPLNANTFGELQESIQSDISSAVSGLQTKIKNGTVVAAKATQDGNGNNIANTYATIKALENEMELRGDLETDLRNGTTPVGKAEAISLSEITAEATNGVAEISLLTDTAYVVVYSEGYDSYCGVLFAPDRDDFAYFSLGSIEGEYNIRDEILTLSADDAYRLESGTVRCFRIGSLDV